MSQVNLHIISLWFLYGTAQVVTSLSSSLIPRLEISQILRWMKRAS